MVSDGSRPRREEERAAWQKLVFERVHKLEQQKLDVSYRELQQAHMASMTTYRNRLDELRSAAVNQLLQGQSDSFNRALIATELKNGDEVRIDPAFRVAVEALATPGKREFYLEAVPELPWSRVGGQLEAIQAIKDAIELPMFPSPGRRLSLLWAKINMPCPMDLRFD